MIRRRAFIAGLAGSIAAPIIVKAQQPKMPIIGFLHTASPGPYARLVEAYLQGLKDTGYVDGRNISIEYRWAEGHFDQLPELVEGLIRDQVALIAALGGSNSALAAKRATSTIPIVFSSGEVDPVKAGLVASLNKPGGNVTGVNPMTSILTAKRLAFLHEIVPQATLIGFLKNSANPITETQFGDVQETARSLAIALFSMDATADDRFEPAFAEFHQKQVGAVFVAADPFFFAHRDQIVGLALRYRIPSSYYTSEFVTAGGLTSYAASFVDAYRLAGTYSGRILKGEKAADLPVEQSVKFDLAINLKTAKVLGLAVPQALLATADEVIE
jgi:putative tryptophan/tyrosine transport system substrate-binding protein